MVHVSTEDSIENPEIWKEKGNEFFKIGNYEEAIKCYSYALQIDPNDIPALNNIGLTFLKMGRIDEAKEIQKKIKMLGKIKEASSPPPEKLNLKPRISNLPKILSGIFVCIGIIILTLILISGTWPAVVTIESESMVPNMNVGDLVFVVSADRFGDLQTWKEGQVTGYTKFDDYGDVIIYKPNGASSVHPIIHRAMVWAEEGQTFQVTTGNLNYSYTAPHAGYITKGDTNAVIDQTGWESDYRGLGPLEPVKDEWLVGKAFFKIPLLGFVFLNIVPMIIIIILIVAAAITWDFFRHKKKRQ